MAPARYVDVVRMVYLVQIWVPGLPGPGYLGFRPWFGSECGRAHLAGQVAPVVQAPGVAQAGQGRQEFRHLGPRGAGEALGQVRRGGRARVGGQSRTQGLELAGQGPGRDGALTPPTI